MCYPSYIRTIGGCVCVCVCVGGGGGWSGGTKGGPSPIKTMCYPDEIRTIGGCGGGGEEGCVCVCGGGGVLRLCVLLAI